AEEEEDVAMPDSDSSFFLKLDAELSAHEAAHVEHLRGIHDAYQLLAELESERRDGGPVRGVRWAMRRYQDFIRLASTSPPADQRALAHAARHVCGSRTAPIP